jgi:Dyp-type peroxidase family
MTLELFDIQGNVVRGYKKLPYGCHLFARINDGALGRAWLAGAVERVTTAELQARSQLNVACNIGFSATGLERLDVPPALLGEFSEEFRDGMAARAKALGDRGDSHPNHWKQDVFRSRSADVVVSVYAEDEDLRTEEVDRLKEEFEERNLKVVHERPIARERSEEHPPREHFGFADGFAQPRIDGAPRDRRAVSTSSPTGDPLPAGEFLLGYEDVDGVLPQGPPGSLGRNGTYMVYREFDQDVVGFRRFLSQQNRDSGLSEELLAAKIVGRWRNGTPLVMSPGDDELPTDRADKDDFGYGDDAHGFRCPLGAHIRRTNPRDMASLGLPITRRHRMIRRGMTYGERLPDGAIENGDAERGLAFICFVASIERQFEFVLAQWCNDGNSFGLGHEADLLLGTDGRAGTMTIQGVPPVFLSRPGGMAPFVTTRGGEYFYLPGIAGLRSLARGILYG